MFSGPGMPIHGPKTLFFKVKTLKFDVSAGLPPGYHRK
jgi:hypothetical protein